MFGNKGFISIHFLFQWIFILSIQPDPAQPTTNPTDMRIPTVRLALENVNPKWVRVGLDLILREVGLCLG